MESNNEMESRLVFPPLGAEETTEVAVIGGGICGLLSAFLLVKAGKSVSVYEKYHFGEGYSVKMPDILQYDADRSFTALKNGFGYEAAAGYYRLCVRALPEIKNMAEEAGASSSVLKDCFTFSDGGVSQSDVEEEYRLRKYSGIDVELISGKEGLDLFSFPFEVGIYSSKGGLYIDKKDLSEKLSCWLSIKGARLYENTKIEYVTQKEDGNGYYLETEDKVSAVAEKVLDCRGLSLLSRYPFLGKREAVFFVKTSPAANFEGWYNRAFIRDMYRDPFYFLPDPKGRVIICGSDSFFPKSTEGFPRFIFDKIKVRRLAGLQETLEEYFYPLGDFNYEKSDFSAYLRTSARLPIAREDPIRKGYFYLTAGNKNTLLSSWLCANCAVNMLSGVDVSEYSLLMR